MQGGSHELAGAPSAATAPLARTIAFMNQKGGVGKTTTAVNLAAGLALAGRRVLLIDMDPQGHASLHLGAAGDESEKPTIYDALMDPDVRLGDVVLQARPNLLLAPTTTDLAAAESELASAPDRALRLKRSIEEFLRAPTRGGPVDFVMIDCPPSLGLLTLNALAAVREVFIPMQAHFLALQGVSKLMQTIGAVGRTVNPHLYVTGVILCMHDSSTTHSREVVADLDAFFEGARGTSEPWSKARVYRPPVRRNVKVAEAPSFGQSIFEYDKNCPGGLDYQALATALAKEWDEVCEGLGRPKREDAPASAPTQVAADPAPGPGAPTGRAEPPSSVPAPKVKVPARKPAVTKGTAS